VLGYEVIVLLFLCPPYFNRFASGLEHPNITQLMGLCMDPHLCIVTEFLPYGNLYDFLHNPDNVMDWPLRLKIALGILSILL
jgi:hypothetical protein